MRSSAATRQKSKLCYCSLSWDWSGHNAWAETLVAESVQFVSYTYTHRGKLASRGLSLDSAFISLTN